MKTNVICRILLAVFAFSLLIPGGEVRAVDRDLPFYPGEKLVFQLKWGVIPAGEAVLEVSSIKTINGIDCYHFVLTAKSTPFIDLFYKVRDHIEAYADLKLTRSLLYQKRQMEDRHVRDIVVNFDWEKRQAQYSNFKKQRAPIPLPRDAFDPLSAFYYVRQFDFGALSELSCPLTDGKKYIMGKAAVIRKETIRVADKTYETYLVEPELQDVAGVFRKSRNAKLQIWITSDKRRIPVMLKSKVVVGSFVGELVSISTPPIAAASE